MRPCQWARAAGTSGPYHELPSGDPPAPLQESDPRGPARFLLISSSARSEHTCPGEISKSYRLMQLAREVLARADRVEIEVLELHRLASEYGRHIHPCKACFSTSPALCHWPCSCYPNYSLGQTQDCMNEIYPLWVAAHGVLIVTPVNWYQVASPVKLMRTPARCSLRATAADAAIVAHNWRRYRSSSRVGTIRATSPGGCSR